MKTLDAPEAGPATTSARLKLYVAGMSARSSRALENLERLLASGLSGPWELEIVDVLENPEVAERERVLATPTLLREFPPPRRRIIGDLSDVEQVLKILAPHRLPPDAGLGASNGVSPQGLQ